MLPKKKKKINCNTLNTHQVICEKEGATHIQYVLPHENDKMYIQLCGATFIVESKINANSTVINM